MKWQFSHFYGTHWKILSGNISKISPVSLPDFFSIIFLKTLVGLKSKLYNLRFLGIVSKAIIEVFFYRIRSWFFLSTTPGIFYALFQRSALRIYADFFPKKYLDSNNFQIHFSFQTCIWKLLGANWKISGKISKENL